MLDRLKAIKLVIEIPRGSRLKIESYMNEEGTYSFKLDRLVPIGYPGAYGFLEGTLSGDGDPRDAFVISERELHTGQELDTSTLVYVGRIQMKDGGEEDEKQLYYLRCRKLEIDEQSLFLVNAIASILVFLQTYKIKPDKLNPIFLESLKISYKPLVDLIKRTEETIVPYVKVLEGPEAEPH